MPPLYSPAEHHKRVPRKQRANMLFRRRLLAECRRDVDFRRAVLKACREDFLFFVNALVWQYNPNSCGPHSPKLGPFTTWEFQDTGARLVLDCVEHRKDVVVEKSREMGASWFLLILVTWFFLFHDLAKALCISRNADAVDKPNDADSLFWKIDFVLRHLPDWVASDATVSRLKMGFENLSNGSQITGQASTGKAGVGGRALLMLVDEFSQIKEDWEVLERTSDTSGCRIFSGTHLGTATAFYELTTKAASAGHLRKMVWHWTQHPDKNKGLYHYDPNTHRVVRHDPHFVYPRDFAFVMDGSPTGGPKPGVRSPWYDVAAEKKGTSRGVAADLDINPSGSVEQVFDALMVRELKVRYARPPAGEYELEYDRTDGTPVRLHPKENGPIKLWTRVSPDGHPPRGRYAFGGDIAAGTGATPSCFSGADCRTGEKVFAYTDSKIEPKELATMMVAVAKLFKDDDGNPAKLVWEIPGPGAVFGKNVIGLGFRNVYFRTTDHRLHKTVSDSPGWTNNNESMQALITHYRDALRGRRFLNRCEHALQECLSFQYGADGYIFHTGAKDPKDPSGARVNHGDRVVADALTWKMVEEIGQLVGPAEVPKNDSVVVGSLGWRILQARVQSVTEASWAD